MRCTKICLMQENIAIFFAPTARFTSRFYKYRLYLQKNGKQILLFTNIHGRRQNVFQGVHKHYFCFRGVQTFLILEAHLIFQLHEGHDLHKSTMSCASKAKKNDFVCKCSRFYIQYKGGYYERRRRERKFNIFLM